MASGDIDSIESILDAMAGRGRDWRNDTDTGEDTADTDEPRSPATQPRKVTDCSVVYSIRLGPEEFAELQFRAEVMSLRPATLPRQFIRRGLGEQDDVAGEDDTVDALVYRIARDAAVLRQLLKRAEQ